MNSFNDFYADSGNVAEDISAASIFGDKNAPVDLVRREPSAILQKILTMIVIISLLVGCVYLVKTLMPSVFYRATHTLQSIGGGADSKAEASRIDAISLLPISDEKKTILIKRNIFMGATSQMIKLALGKPRSTKNIANVAGTSQIQMVYHFKRDGKPTIFLFEGNKLINAHKASYTDL